MLYERKPEKAAYERESSSVVQRDQIEKSEYGKEAEAFRNRPIPKVNFDFMKLHSIPIAGPAIQPKLTIGEPNDKYEQEADRVAAEVVQEINRPAPVSQAQGEVVQGKEKKEEDELNTKPMVPRREAIGGVEASTELESAINRARGGGQPLEEGLQQSMGEAMGADFSDVRVHTDAQADQLNQSLQAKAFTTGQDVFFRQGAYQPGSRDGKELIAHELTHVVQQKGVSSKSTPRSKELLRPLASWQRPAASEGEGCARFLSDRGVAVRREVLSKDVLNVVGEVHKESDERRDAEKEYTTAETGSENYWRENEFTYKPASRREEGLTAAAGDPKRYRIFFYLLHRVDYYINDLMPAVHEWLSQGSFNLRKETILRRIKNLDERVGWIVQEADELRQSEELNNLPKLVRDYPAKIFEDGGVIRKLLVLVKEKLTAKQVSQSEVAEQIKTMIDQLKRWRTLIFVMWTEDPRVPYAPKLLSTYIKTASMDRAESMHECAEQRHEDRGVWKIGEAHIGQIKRLSEDLGRKYNLVEKQQFDQGYAKWKKKAIP